MKLFNIRLLAVAALLILSACATSPHRRLAKVAALQKHARQAYDQGNLAVALENYRTLAHRMPSDNAAWFHLGNVYARLDQPRLAGKAYRHVLQRDPTHSKAWHNLGVVYLHQAEAAFVQSTRTANGNPSLRKASMHMARQLDTLSAAPKSTGRRVPAPAASSAGVPPNPSPSGKRVIDDVGGTSP